MSENDTDKSAFGVPAHGWAGLQPQCVQLNVQMIFLSLSAHTKDVPCLAGDQVGHLWWRMLSGELPAINQPGVLVILIGAPALPQCWKQQRAPVCPDIALLDLHFCRHS